MVVFARGSKDTPLTNVFCPVDVNALDSLKEALWKGYAIAIEEAEIGGIPASLEGETIDVILSLGGSIEHKKVELSHSYLRDANSGENLIKYSQIEDNYGLTCGMQFRDIPITGFEEYQPNNEACFNFIYAGIRNVVCINQPVRPVVKARKLLKAIHELCIKGKLEEGDVAAILAQSPVDEQQEGNTAITTGGLVDYIDPTLKSDPANGNWSGEVYWIELGNAVVESNAVEGSLLVKGRMVKLTDADNNVLPIELNLLQYYNRCNSNEPCTLENWMVKISAIQAKLKYQETLSVVQWFMM